MVQPCFLFTVCFLRTDTMWPVSLLFLPPCILCLLENLPGHDRLQAFKIDPFSLTLFVSGVGGRKEDRKSREKTTDYFTVWVRVSQLQSAYENSQPSCFTERKVWQKATSLLVLLIFLIAVAKIHERITKRRDLAHGFRQFDPSFSSVVLGIMTIKNTGGGSLLQTGRLKEVEQL